ncbi:MAG: peptide deformylase [Candidatus Taylorbacteria bacterium]|nr:peptide deformylase [Candidatus Taylorbacteria bacterium]
MVDIIQNGNPILREVAHPVSLEECGSSRIKKVISDMREALASQSDGVAIAAPQIAQSLRIFLVSGKVLKEANPELYKDLPDEIVFINPEITKLSKETQILEEGCLSVRWLYGKVKRSKKASIRAYDVTGKKFERGASGLLAQIFQHEVDHLNGVLFIDKAFDIEEVLPEHIEARTKNKKKLSE